MQLAIRLARLQLHPCVRSPFHPSARRETACVQVRLKSSQQGNREEEMENNKKEHRDNGDVMSQSFGEGYSTRSDEEGFGCVYGGNQAFRKREEGEDIHENHPGKMGYADWIMDTYPAWVELSLPFTFRKHAYRIEQLSNILCLCDSIKNSYSNGRSSLGPEYDKSQGSEVKEKEKGRHQPEKMAKS